MILKIYLGFKSDVFQYVFRKLSLIYKLIYCILYLIISSSLNYNIDYK